MNQEISKLKVVAFKNYRGHYPESVHADHIYRTTENRKFCQKIGMRLSGLALARPPTNIDKEKKKQARLDERLRNYIEGKFGQAKRRLSLDKIMTKLSETSVTAIAITFLVINLSTLLKKAFSLFLYFFGEKTVFNE